MKKLILLFLINFSVMGAWYKAPVSEIEKKFLDCSYPLAVLKICKGDCAEVTNQFSCEYSKISDELVNDLTKPINSKSEIESCLDEVHCQNKLEAKTCSDESERAIKNLDSLEIYCSKITGYEQKLSGRKIIVIDEAKKLSHDAKNLKKKNRRKKIKRGLVNRQKCEDAISYITGMNAESDADEATVDAMMTSFFEIYKALDSGRPSKAVRLINLVTDPAQDALKNELLKILE